MPDDLYQIEDVARDGIGGNFPPLKEFFAEINTTLDAQLAADAENLMERVKALADAEARMPKTIADGDGETAGRAIAFAVQIIDCIKEAEAKRVDLTEGPLKSQRKIMEFYRTGVFTVLGEVTADKKTGSFGGLRQRVGDIITNYEARKVALERQKLEEEQRLAREAAEAAERARLEVERLTREAEEVEIKRQADAVAAMNSEQDLVAAVAAEAKAKEDQAAREAMARAAADEAARLQTAAALAAEAADQKTSTLSRTAGAFGTSSSLRENWKARIKSHDDLKADPKAMALVWDHIKPESIEDACNRIAKLKKNTVKISGVEFFDASRAVVRG